MISRERAVDIALALFCAAMLAAMLLVEGEETIPYHFLFLAVAIVYGFRVWPMRATIIVVTAITLATGLIFFRSLLKDSIDLSEMWEVLLMPLLLMAMVWHARRREAAMRAVERMAAVNHALLEREHEFLRETSHAIRTPVTIARGYVELALAETTEDEIADHLEVVDRQLTRTETLSTRLLSLASLDSTGITHVDMIDLAAVVRRASRDWTGSADRVWVQELGAPAWILGDPTAVEAALDAMVENSRHFTGRRDVIRITCRTLADSVVLEVADSGPGILEQDRERVFQRYWHQTPPDGVVGSGLGLAMVAAIAQAHGGEARAGRAPEGGALVTMTLPRQPWAAGFPAISRPDNAWWPTSTQDSVTDQASSTSMSDGVHG
jgi:signal transduction histidine kinase